MFGPSFNHDPFRHLSMPSAFSYANYIAPPHAKYPRAHQNRHVPPPPPPPLQPHHYHDHAPHQRHGFDLEHYPNSSPSNQDYSAEDAYYHSSSETNSSPTPPPAVLHTAGSHWKQKKKKDKEEGHMIPTFQLKTFVLPATSPLNLPPFAPSSSPAVLILPPNLPLTPLHIHLTTLASPSTSTSIHAAVASAMRFRDVICQLLSPGVQVQGADVRTHVKVRGEWQEPGGRVRVCEVVDVVGRRGVDGRREVEMEVWVDVCGRGGGNAGRSGNGGMREKGGGGDGRVRGWETERGRMWEYKA
ncbi:hypothetical protein DDE83_008004 [Stemphylium lycopersici]|uniref:Uncharacterized protein n=1 Tax=Stemphylium lycopersici TaxID=183478 RepID=A0A364MUN2_STELY|nr:hypothetical protein DDE83_008004 [Stemphylium lycopersici]